MLRKVFGRIMQEEWTDSTSSGIGSGQLPGRIHHDDIELCRCDERRPVIGHNVGMDGDAVWGHLPLAGVQVIYIAQREVDALLPLYMSIDMLSRQILPP